MWWDWLRSLHLSFIGMKLRKCIILRYLSLVKNMTTLLQQAIAEIEHLSPADWKPKSKNDSPPEAV